MATAVAPPKTPPTSTSVDPLYTAALAQAKASLAAQTAPIKAEQSASDAQFQQRQTDATGVAKSLSELLQPIGPAVNGMYQTAAQNQELAANGFSQGMQDALKGNTDNLNAMLQSLHSPAQLDSHAPEAGDMVYALGGFNPGRSFSQQGAAFGSAAELQSGDALLRGQENVKSLKAQAIVADQGFQNKIAELAGKLPGDVQTNYQHLQTIALNDAKFRETVTKDNFDAAMKQAYFKLAQAKYSTDVQYKNSQLQLSSQRVALESQRISNQQYNADRNYQAKLVGLGIQQKRLQLSIMNSSFKAASGGLTRQEVSKYTSVAQSIAMQGVNGYTTYTSKGGVKTPQTVGKVSYFEALGQALRKGVPVQIALDALDRVYPKQYQPTAQALAAQLGPLDPKAMQQVAQQQLAQARASVPTTGGQPGKPGSTAYGPAGGFLPAGAQFKMNRVDQGRDIQTTPGAAIVSPGEGYVVRIGSDPGGGGGHFGPSYPIVHFTSGPYAGKTMYIGHTVSALHAGAKFRAGDVLSATQQSGPLNGGAPSGWAEIGFAPGGTPGSFGQAPPF